MTIAIEPGIYINDKFGIRIEDTVLVKKKKSEILTSAIY
jgi:Xaa-Pro dipeptidase